MALERSSVSISMLLMRKRMMTSTFWLPCKPSCTSRHTILMMKMSSCCFPVSSRYQFLSSVSGHQGGTCLFHSNSHGASVHLASRKSVPPDFPAIQLLPQGLKDEAKFGSLVYVGRLNNQILLTKFISLSSSILGFAAQPLIISQLSNLPIILSMAMGMMGTFFIYVTPFLLHLMVRKYVMRIYYDGSNGSFTAVALRFFPLRRFITFSPSDVYIPKVTSTLAVICVRQKNGQKDIPLFINPPDFMDQSVYGKMMGYDKPIVLNEEEEEHK